MAAAEPPPPTGMGFLGLLSFRRSATAVASFDPAQDDELQVLDALQAHVADRLAALSHQPPLLSLAFLSKLLDALLSSDDAFRDVLGIGPVAAALSRPPADRLAADLLDRTVKTLDILNASPTSASPGAGCGLGLALYTMSSVLVFSMWALVAAVPCQDRASAATNPPVAPPKQVQWAAPMSALQERISDEWRKKDKKGSSSGSAATGLLAEMQAVERAARELSSVLEEVAEEEEEEQLVMGVSAERAHDVVERAEALAAACRALEEGLAPLERQVRTVFHRVVASRGEVVRIMEHSTRSNSSATANAAAASGSGAPPHHHSF
uniref:Uncharacterized protein n=1 Tax=Oryza punctata TaxID=4537 RepID=A0A0E0JUI0_ORYPU